ncbi:hypothetical protein [Aurantibacter sp.]|uniref:hypothetical protein n=1 Tax=Aurantibacter sp. TaxID=2807103 RepID=UPI0032664B9A
MSIKSYFIYLWIVLILSCSNSDESPSTGTHFEPPSWIIGIWEETMPIFSNNPRIYEFTSNNFIHRSWPGSTEGLDYNKSINNMFTHKIVERNHDTTYEIDLYISGDEPTTFWKFIKISNLEINCWLKDGLLNAPQEFNLIKLN